ncbi:MAG TPA: hypothetical protein PKH68_01425 [Paludibacteraceae bacterium]|nr:hypothetical protein [Paludibacteraceae bacterium]
MNLTEKQIIDLKIVLSGKANDLLANEIGIRKEYFSKLEKYPGKTEKIKKYFNENYPEFDLAIKKLTEFENVIQEPEGIYEKRKCLNCNDLEKQVQYWKGKYEGLKEGLVLKNEESYKQTGSE